MQTMQNLITKKADTAFPSLIEEVVAVGLN